MTITYEAIATTTLGSAASSYTFTSIPSTYTDLVLVTSIQATSSGQGLYLQFNGDTGSNYSYTYLRGNGSTATSGRATNNTLCLLSTIAEPPTTGFATYIAQLQSYAGSTYKTSLVRANAAAAGVEAIVNLWRNTSAINEVRIFISGGNMNTGSTFTLYGIKAE
jgi:hypothetical protein